MKKTISALLIIPILIFSLFGCAEKIYKLPWDQFCTYRDLVVDLDSDGRLYVIDLLNDLEWRDGVANCACDFTFYTQKQRVGYHSDCGTFIDFTRAKCASVNAEKRTKLNGVLGVDELKGGSKCDHSDTDGDGKCDVCDYPVSALPTIP